MLQQVINYRTYKKLRDRTKLTECESEAVKKVIHPPTNYNVNRALTSVEQRNFESAISKFRETAKKLGIGYKGIYL